MARRKTDRLTQVEINRLTNRKQWQPGLHPDGLGLYLNVTESGTASWLFRYMLTGKPHYMGLGAYPLIGLKAARDRRDDRRRQLLDGIDPLSSKQEEKARKTAERAAMVTFRTAAETYIKAHRAGWRNAKHAGQWDQTLADYVYPVIGALPAAAVETGHVSKILEPIWTTKAETATRVRGRIESILDFAKTKGWRTGENPARWKGHLENTLPARAKVAKVEHHPALPWREIGAFMVDLGKRDDIARLALRFAILTAARTQEVVHATWGEIDMRAPRRVMIGRDDKGEPIHDTIGAVWSVPGGRMKAGKEHRVPLSPAALELLQKAAKLRRGKDPSDPVFPGGNLGVAQKGLSNSALIQLLHRMKRDDLTVHGFRSTFRDWCAEATGYPRELAEAALAHALDSKVEAAYQRGDLLEKRRRLMNDWATFCGRIPSADVDNVTPLRPAEVVA